MQNSKVRLLIPIFLVILIAWYLHKNQNQNTSPSAIPTLTTSPYVTANTASNVTPQTVHNEKKAALDLTATAKAPPLKTIEFSTKAVSNKNEKPQALHYRADSEGLATVDEDIVLGELKPGTAAEGLVSPPEIQLWMEGRIPYHIQPDVGNPERIAEAMALFEGTPITFVPFNGEKDAVVFQNYSKDCKSYLGRIGGHQPIFIASNCEAPEIAHEIMHALGFIHEQNRLDRDAYVSVAWDNVIESAKINFERFPENLMKLNGRSAFDYESLMIYPPNSFSKNGQDTLLSTPGNRILPGRQLSPKDRQRLNEVYGQ